MNTPSHTDRLAQLRDYPFAKLNQICPAKPDTISMAAGEPTEQPAQSVMASLSAPLYHKYPPIQGIPELNRAVSTYTQDRFSLQQQINSDSIVITNGSREAIFSLVSLFNTPNKVIAFCNPFYQIYMGASVMNDCEYICLQKNDFLKCADDVWSQIGILILCSPDNPTGSSIQKSEYDFFTAKAQQHNFILIVDECYIDLYDPTGLKPLGLLDYLDKNNLPLHNMLVLHSLSKRSNAAGLRSAAVIGDPELLTKYQQYRTWHGVSMSLPVQQASAQAWVDAEFVQAVRHRYTERFQAFCQNLPRIYNQTLQQPDGSFYLWVNIQGDDRLFAEQLFSHTNITVLPGRWLSSPQPRDDFSWKNIQTFKQRQDINPTDLHHDSINPGTGFIRLALVDSPEKCAQAAKLMAKFIDTRWHELKNLPTDHLPH